MLIEAINNAGQLTGIVVVVPVFRKFVTMSTQTSILTRCLDLLNH